MCTIIIHIICEWHAEARGVGGGGRWRGKDSLQLKTGKCGWSAESAIAKIQAKVIIIENICII